MIFSTCNPITAAILLLLMFHDGARGQIGSLTIEEIVRLAKSGISEELVVARLKRNGRAFDLNEDEISELKKSGISETVLKFLIDPSLPYVPPQAAEASDLASRKPNSQSIDLELSADPLVRNVPKQLGLYYLDPESQSYRSLDLNAIIPSKETGKFVGKISAGLIKGRAWGSLLEKRARMRTAVGEVVFFARLKPGESVGDFNLIALEIAENRRDLDFGRSSSSPTFPLKSLVSFQSKEVGPSLFKISATMDKQGEFMFLIRGSGDEKKGTLGKGYDFGVD